MNCKLLPLVVTLFLSTLCAVTPDAVESQSSGRSLFTREEKEKDFLDWVARVGAKNHSAAVIDDFARVREQAGSVIKVGAGGYSSVQSAVDAASPGTVVQIAAGTYKEKVKVSTSYITFQGAGAGSTIIVWDDTTASTGSTEKSASVTIEGSNFVARDVTFSNSAPSPPKGSKDRQTVALRVTGDKAAFYDCSFTGYQDTLFDDSGRHYFEGCYIEGSVDFICGNGQSLYKGCQLHALQRKTESLTAQRRTSPGDSSGFSFVNCRVTGAGRAYLGRAWGKYSRVVFSYTYMDAMILPVGWYNWGDSSRESTVFYGQYMCTGPGASDAGRVSWARELTADQAAPFLSTSFIDGGSWLPTS